ncbi:MAG TPA: VWA domain-containing protein, partial [Verrucomicrobiae bacterium]|nr:VWA domain-containing protein [Verrucomicrobiae bacterium]
LFGSGEQSKRELAAEIASVLAFSAIRNNDKVGLILFTEDVEKFIPPRKGRRHVLRVIREILFFSPKKRGTNLNHALEFLTRVTPHKAIAVVVSDFLGQNLAQQSPQGTPRRQSSFVLPQSLAQASYAALRQANRRHDLVAIQITDRYELELPPLGRLVLKDAETGEVVEVNTGDARKRAAFAQRQVKAQTELMRVFRAANIDSIQLRTDQPYSSALGRFFETREKRRLHG